MRSLRYWSFQFVLAFFAAVPIIVRLVRFLGLPGVLVLLVGIILAVVVIIQIVVTLGLATVYKGNIIKNLIMDCQSYTKYRPNETTGGIFVSWRRKEELPTGA